MWTIGSVRNGLDVHLGQIVCDKDEVVDWCIVEVEMPLTRFEERWPLPTKYCDGKLTKIPKRDFIFARVKTGQVGT